MRRMSNTAGRASYLQRVFADIDNSVLSSHTYRNATPATDKYNNYKWNNLTERLFQIFSCQFDTRHAAVRFSGFPRSPVFHSTFSIPALSFRAFFVFITDRGNRELS